MSQFFIFLLQLFTALAAVRSGQDNACAKKEAGYAYDVFSHFH